MSLSTTLKEIKKILPVAETEPSDEFPETLSARRGRQRAAKEKLKMLRREYSDGLLNSAVFIVVTGTLADDFAKASTGKKLACFTADPETFYRDLADRVPTSLIGKEGTNNLFDILSRHLEDKAQELGLVEYSQIQFKKEYARKVSNREEFVQLVKRAINEQVGSEIVAIQAARSLTDDAIKRNHSMTVTPIVLATTDEKFASDIVKAISSTRNKAFLVLAGETNVEGLAARSITTETATPAAVATVLKQIVTMTK